jgi:hypothetical protein
VFGLAKSNSGRFFSVLAGIVLLLKMCCSFLVLLRSNYSSAWVSLYGTTLPFCLDLVWLYRPNHRAFRNSKALNQKSQISDGLYISAARPRIQKRLKQKMLSSKASFPVHHSRPRVRGRLGDPVRPFLASNADGGGRGGGGRDGGLGGLVQWASCACG